MLGLNAEGQRVLGRCRLCWTRDATPPMTPALPAGRRPGHQPPEVLLVDDDEVSLMLIAIALRERGFDIIEAGGGDRALQLLTDGRPTSSCSTR